MWLSSGKGSSTFARKGERNGLVAVAIDKDKRSQDALKWAAENLINRGQTIILIHVIPKPSASRTQQLLDIRPFLNPCMHLRVSPHYQVLCLDVSNMAQPDLARFSVALGHEFIDLKKFRSPRKALNFAQPISKNSGRAEPGESNELIP